MPTVKVIGAEEVQEDNRRYVALEMTDAAAECIILLRDRNVVKTVAVDCRASDFERPLDEFCAMFTAPATAAALSVVLGARFDEKAHADGSLKVQ